MNMRQYMREKFGIDDSNFAYPFPEHVDVFEDRSDEGGPIVGVIYDRDPEKVERCRRNLMRIANQVVDRLEREYDEKVREAENAEPVTI